MDAKTKSKNSFNSQASIYDTSDFSRYPRECYPHVIKAIQSIDFDKVLDLGCGTGIILEQIRVINHTAELFGLDLSENMISQAVQRLNTGASLSVGDAENLPYEDQSFDLVCCVQSFHHYPNPIKAISEIKRILKKNGTFLLCDTWARSPMRQVMNFFIRFSDDGDVHIYSEREINKILAQMGLRKISWKTITNHAYLCISKNNLD